MKYATKRNIFYLPIPEAQADSYQKKQCKLDIYYPTNCKNYATVIWFHGGGLYSGQKSIPEAFKNQGFAVVAVDFRLHPKVKCPVYIHDAAAATAWVCKNIAQYGGRKDGIFLVGRSAGSYLTLMLGLDSRWLKEYGVNANHIAGLVTFSGHAITHFTIREERGIDRTQPVVDEYAPLYYVRKKTMPILILTGDRELELLGRYEENAYFARMMKICGNKKITQCEFEGYGHDVMTPGCPIAVQWIHNILAEKDKAENRKKGKASPAQPK